MRETIDGITVLRGWLFASPKLSKLTKAAGFASFAASASLQALLRRRARRRGGGDLAAAHRGHPRHAAGAAPRRAARLRRARHLARGDRRLGAAAERLADPRPRTPRARDLRGVERGHGRDRGQARAAAREGRRAREGLRDPERRRPAAASRAVEPMPDDGVARRSASTRSASRVLYAGIMNPPQGLDVLLDAARARCARCRAALAARASRSCWSAPAPSARGCEARVRDEGLGEIVRFVAEQPRDAIPPLLRSAGRDRGDAAAAQGHPHGPVQALRGDGERAARAGLRRRRARRDPARGRRPASPRRRATRRRSPTRSGRCSTTPEHGRAPSGTAAAPTPRTSTGGGWSSASRTVLRGVVSHGAARRT